MALVLTADDNQTTQKVIQLTLEPHGFQVQTYASVDALMEALKNGLRPATVIVSSTLSDFEDGETCPRIRETVTRNDLPIILTTGAFQTVGDQECQRQACDALLAKPFSTDGLLQTVKRLTAETGETPPPPESPAQPPPPEGPARLTGSLGESFPPVDTRDRPPAGLLKIPVRPITDRNRLRLRPGKCGAGFKPLVRELWEPSGENS